MTMKKWVAERNEVHDWEKEKTLSGVYTSSRVVTTENGDVNMYTIDKGGGKMVDVWGKTMLNDFFKNMKFGETIEITYIGKEKSKKGGRTYHNFEFSHDDSTVPEVDVNEDIADVAQKEFGV